jgi:cytochrome P450
MSQDSALTEGALRFRQLPMAENRAEAYRMIREAGPVIKTPRGYVLSSSEYVEYALKHPELFSPKQAFDIVGSPLPRVPIAFDPPEHTRYRRILQPFVGPREATGWQPRVRALVGALIDSFVERGHCDLVAEVAVPLPAEVFLTLFGLPMEDRDRLIAWKEGLLGSPILSGGQPTEEMIRVGAELFTYLVGHIEKRRRHPDATEDLLGRLLADTSEERLSDEELLGLSFLFVLAGLDTVTSAPSTAFAALAMQPRLRQQIAADPSVIPDAVEELLRMDGPVVFLPRVASRDVVMGQSHDPRGLGGPGRHRSREQGPGQALRPRRDRPAPPGTASRVRRRAAPLSRLPPRQDGDARGAGRLAPPYSRVRAGTGIHSPGAVADGSDRARHPAARLPERCRGGGLARDRVRRSTFHAGEPASAAARWRRRRFPTIPASRDDDFLHASEHWRWKFASAISLRPMLVRRGRPHRSPPSEAQRQSRQRMRLSRELSICATRDLR